MWLITLNHDKYESRIKGIEASYRRSKDVNQRQKLEAPGGSSPRGPGGHRSNASLGGTSTTRSEKGGKVAVEGEEEEDEEQKKKQEEPHKEVRDHMPPAFFSSSSAT